MLKVSESLAQSPGGEFELSRVDTSSDVSSVIPGEAFLCDAECMVPDVPASEASIESDNASPSPQINPSAENRFVREDPW